MNLYYQAVAEILFVGFILLVIFGALLSVRARILMHAVLGLAVSLLGVAGLYFYLDSMFLTLMQILIYVGAIGIVLIFGIMVGYTPNEIAEKNKFGRNLLLGIISSGVGGFLLITASVCKTQWAVSEKIADFSMEHVGLSLLYKYCLAFELISVVLLIAIVGSVILANGGREERS